MQHLAETVVSRLTPTCAADQRAGASPATRSGELGRLRRHAIRRIRLRHHRLAAPAAAQVLRIVSPELSAELGAIQYSSSITVGLGYDRDVRQSLPPGFGFLVPRSEGKKLLAATFVHNKFPHRAPEDRALLRCFFAGSNAEDVWPLADDQIIGIVRNELQQILGLRAEPTLRARLQVEIGHGAIRRRTSRTARPHGTPAPATTWSSARWQCLPRHRCPRLRPLRPRRGKALVET